LAQQLPLKSGFIQKLSTGSALVRSPSRYINGEAASFFVHKTEAPEATIFRADLQDPQESLPIFTKPQPRLIPIVVLLIPWCQENLPRDVESCVGVSRTSGLQCCNELLVVERASAEPLYDAGELVAMKTEMDRRRRIALHLDRGPPQLHPLVSHIDPDPLDSCLALHRLRV
jgi:hypothetical protein